MNLQFMFIFLNVSASVCLDRKETDGEAMRLTLLYIARA
jgi:hypothetical protein